MSTNISVRIDRFYLMLGSVLVVLAVIVALTLRGILGAVNKSNEVDPSGLDKGGIHITETKLNEAKDLLKNKNDMPPLDLP